MTKTTKKTTKKAAKKAVKKTAKKSGNPYENDPQYQANINSMGMLADCCGIVQMIYKPKEGYYDKIKVWEVPDVNLGFVCGWIVMINYECQFIGAIDEFDRMHSWLRELYRDYITENYNITIDEDDFAIEFNDVFEDAMSQAGFEMDEDGHWERKTHGKK